ncbi:MAG: YCF48-related protein [Deltaproteobacteria bacterium]|nr:YCF48-related protein [Deltaproteobacteria bacterium]
MRGFGAQARAALRIGGVALIGAMWLAVAASAAPAPQSAVLKDNLYGTKFIAPHEGWAVGAFGSIFHTTDGGRTWQPQVSKTTQQLYDVDFVDAKRGWVVGRSGLILHTQDGGETWVPQPSGIGPEKHLFSVDFADAQHGIIAGDWGVILSTSDGGATWVNRSLPDDVILNDVSMVDTSHAWIAGELGTILATQDGGATWTRQDIGLDKTLYGISFNDVQHGWAVCIDALILRTSDGGQHWQVINGSTEVRELEQVGFSSAYENPSLYAVQVVGDLGIAVGEIGAVFLSTDGGQTWTRRAGGDRRGPKWFRALSVGPGRNGAIVGAGGERLRIVEGRIEQPDGGARAAETLH